MAEEQEDRIMRAFERLVADASKNEINFVIRNGTFGHAKVLFTEIIGKAKKCVSLVTGCDPDFYQIKEVREAFLKFIQDTKGKGVIRVFFESSKTDSDVRQNILIETLCSAYKKLEQSNSLEIYRLKNDKEVTYKEKKLHLLLADTEGPYRFEAHIENDKNLTKIIPLSDRVTDAIANFGDKNNSGNLWRFVEKQIKANAVRVAL